jgi:acetate kinase
MNVLAVNAGSSTLKLTLLNDQDHVLGSRELATPRAAIDRAQLHEALQDGLGEADAVGHRIVHGGERFRHEVLIDAGVERALRELVEMAPLHQPTSLAALDAVSQALPDAPAVACFDTSFHATLSPAAHTYALPAAWRRRWPIRRYGFHGLSHAWVARRAPELLREARDLRIVSCHLGAGASLCAISGGCSVDTSMGFTPLEGLVMATRSGSVDPGLLLWLMERTRMPERELASALEHDSGLRGLAGTADMRELLARADARDGDAQLALDVYVHRLRAGIAAMAAALGGVDALAFTGGVGERSPVIRARTLAGLRFLGAGLDAAKNDAASEDAAAGVAPADPTHGAFVPGNSARPAAAPGDVEITAPGARVRTLVVHAREDLEIAAQVRAVMKRSQPSRASGA